MVDGVRTQARVAPIMNAAPLPKTPTRQLNHMKQKKWAIVAAIILVAALGFVTLRYFYWLNQSGLPVYP
ncbi:MAG: hypothetical protein IT566_05625 [Rhodospirillaceae bacterium]|nr:hypothetical protein [Rhodospirillaceae bacterium]